MLDKITQKLVFAAVFFSLFNLLFSGANAASIDCDKIRNDEQVCLACNLYHEARGEEELGIAAVAMVTLNRVHSSAYPNSICKVVWQKFQFSWTNDERSDQIYDILRWENVLRISKMVLDKTLNISKIDPTVLWYHRYDIEKDWSNKMQVAARVGNHKFFKRLP